MRAPPFPLQLLPALLLATACAHGATRSGASVERQVDPPSAISAMDEAERMSSAVEWPGFRPHEVPVAVFDGERTMLFGHPAPPVEFASLSAHQGAWAHAGRHPAVTSNSTVELGGVLTATVLGHETRSTREVAATILHERFHVYQRQHHPGWVANEVELFTYPVESDLLLARARLEMEALRRALVSRNDGESACWARAAMTYRRERHGDLSPGAVAYERLNELNEGLARYIELRALGTPAERALPSTAARLPEAVRDRTYASGAALALLLDRHAREWKTRIAVTEVAALDELLSAAVAPGRVGASCELPDDLRRQVHQSAAADIRELHERRERRRREFLARDGWTLEIMADAAPLFPQAFDPLNVERVGPGEVLHSRFLRLGSAGGGMEVLDRPALTRAAGDHPLFNGVRSVLLTGFTSPPEISDAAGTVTISAPGLEATFRGAHVRREGFTITVHAGPAPADSP